MPPRPTTKRIQVDHSLPHAFYWGSESLFGGIYQVLGRADKGQVMIKRIHSFLNGEILVATGNEFLNTWPIPARTSIVIEFKTKECLQHFLSNPVIDCGRVGSASVPVTGLGM